jgi:hypothetical protein
MLVTYCCQGFETRDVNMKWACRLEVEAKKCIKNFGGKLSGKDRSEGSYYSKMKWFEVAELN